VKNLQSQMTKRLRHIYVAELKSIASAEAAANKELQEAVGVVLLNVAEQMLKRFKK